MSKGEAKSSPAPSFSHRAEYAALIGVVRMLALVDWNTAGVIGARLGALGYRPLRIRKHIVEKQIGAAFPELDEAGVQRMARASFEHLGRSSIETALLPTLGEKGVLHVVERVDGWDHMERGLEGRKGVVIVAGHHGNWELLGAYIAARGVPIDVIVRGMSNKLFDEYLNDTRTKLGMTVVHDSEAVRRAPRSLREGRAVAFVADQGVLGLASTFVPFFGRPAKTPRGAAVFALRFNAPVLFVDALRLAGGKYRIIIEPVEAELTGDRDRDVDAIVLRFTQVLESWVRRYPEQYFWQHRRWRRQPPDTPPELRDPTRAK
ncbi:MAG TPA: lysophospholipid acyltransferase family protein [Gemmatimonadaceae bacterium]|nr:lysophospholipid acyltransferase family protein [Gemmatimonadaceae bacterium]